MISVNKIIRVNTSDILPTSNVQPGIPCRAKAAILFPYDSQPVIPPCILFTDVRTVIGAAVIHKYYLKIMFCLTDETVKASAQHPLHIINRYDNRHFGLVVHVYIRVIQVIYP